MRHIIVTTDGSSGANRAVDVAAELANALGGDLSIVTIGGGLSGEQMRQLAPAEGNIGGALEALAIGILMAAKEQAQRLGASSIQVQTGWG